MKHDSILPSFTGKFLSLNDSEVRCCNCSTVIKRVTAARGTVIKGISYQGYFITWSGALCSKCESITTTMEDKFGNRREVVRVEFTPNVLHVPEREHIPAVEVDWRVIVEEGKRIPAPVMTNKVDNH